MKYVAIVKMIDIRQVEIESDVLLTTKDVEAIAIEKSKSEFGEYDYCELSEFEYRQSE